MSNKYWVNSGVIKASGPSSLNTYTGFDDIVCDILKCKFGMDCCTGEDETPGACCVHISNTVDPPVCAEFEGSYYIDGNGDIYTCRNGVAKSMGQFMVHFTGTDVNFDAGTDDLVVTHEGVAGDLYLTMTDAPVANVSLSYIDGVDPANLTAVAAGVGSANIMAMDNAIIAQVKVQDEGTVTISSSTGQVLVPNLGNYVDDAAAAVGGVLLNGLYHNAGALRIRIV